MYSDKYKPGTRVYYLGQFNPGKGKKVYGTVVTKEEALQHYSSADSGRGEQIYALWDNSSDPTRSSIGWMPDCDVFTDDETLNLPDWF